MVHLAIHNGCCNDNVDTTLEWRRQIKNVFTTSILQHCTNLVSALQRKSNADCCMHCRVVTFPQRFHKTLKTINNDTIFVCCESCNIKFRSLLFFPHTLKVLKICFLKV